MPNAQTVPEKKVSAALGATNRVVMRATA